MAIRLFTAPTPNGWKVSIMLEECGLPYDVTWIDIGRGEQFQPEFLLISPNGKVPAILDLEPGDGGDPLSVFETGAILNYLAEKTGRFHGSNLRERKAVNEWLFWQVGGLGPMLGQHGHFKLYAPERLDYAVDRYEREARRLYTVLDDRLKRQPHVALYDYTIADMAIFPWVQTWRAQEIALDDFPCVQDWYKRLKMRPGLRRGMALGREQTSRRPQDDPQTRRWLFGA